MLGVFQLLETFRQGGKVLGEVDQEFDPFLTIRDAQLGDDGFKCGGQSVGPRRAIKRSGEDRVPRSWCIGLGHDPKTGRLNNSHPPGLSSLKGK